MVCLNVNDTAVLYYSGSIEVGTVCMASKSEGQKALTNTAAPKSVSFLKLLKGKLCSVDLVRKQGRPKFCGKKRLNAPQKQRGKGFGIQRKISRDNNGKVLLPAKTALNSKDLSSRVQPK